MLLAEVNLMRQMDHPYIVKIIATYMSFEVLHIVMELVRAYGGRWRWYGWGAGG